MVGRGQVGAMWQGVENPADIFGVVDMVGMVQHRRHNAELRHLLRLAGILWEPQAVQFVAVCGVVVVALERVHEVVHPHDVARGQLHNGPIGGGRDNGGALAVENLRVAEGEEAVGATRPCAEGDVLCLVGQTVEAVVGAAYHPCPASLDEFGESDAAGLGMEAGNFLKETHHRPGSELVVLVAKVVGGDELLGVVHGSFF